MTKDIEVELYQDGVWIPTQLSKIKEGHHFRCDESWPEDEREFVATHDAELVRGQWSVEAVLWIRRKNED